ncbi:division/cell wall cluster transcriptional repressor MraZ [Nocardioides lentus]|uniref:Transcriptional regulator MraZ n=1 Tax=Nocardioides lentus TaxID=338077 RepID=A0ABP5AHA2_9ACTN
MFFGNFTPKLDDKGRLILPAKFRDDFSEGVVMVKGQERCVNLLTMAEFEAVASRLREASMTNKSTRDYVRVLFAAAYDQVPDKQGRVSVPAHLREYASLDRDVVVNGAMDRVEIWAPDAWSSYSAEQEQKFAELSDEVFPGI